MGDRWKFWGKVFQFLLRLYIQLRFIITVWADEKILVSMTSSFERYTKIKPRRKGSPTSHDDYDTRKWSPQNDTSLVIWICIKISKSFVIMPRNRYIAKYEYEFAIYIYVIKNNLRTQRSRGEKKYLENMIWERKQQVGSSSRIHWNVCCLLSNWILFGVEIYISAQKERKVSLSIVICL